MSHHFLKKKKKKKKVQTNATQSSLVRNETETSPSQRVCWLVIVLRVGTRQRECRSYNSTGVVWAVARGNR